MDPLRTYDYLALSRGRILDHVRALVAERKDIDYNVLMYDRRPVGGAH